MLEYSFEQLVDLERVRSLLQGHHKITGVCSAILDLEQNILVAEGWEDICTNFFRVHPVTCARCLESNEHITHRLHEVEGGYREIKCKNGLWDVAMPINIGGSMVATFFIGQFFYADEEVDEAFFRAQAAQFGFDEETFIAALRKVPVFSREQIRNILEFYRELVKVLAESGLKELRLLKEVEERKRAEEALATRERDFRSLAENLPDNVMRWDTRGRYLYINPTHERILGGSAGDYIGKQIPEKYAETKAAVARVAAYGRTEQSIRQEVLVDGVIRLHDICLVPEFDDDGRMVSILGIGRDMTDLYRMQETIAAREQEYRSLAESSPDHIIRYDRKGRILYLNTTLVRRLELNTAGEVIGKRPCEVWPDGRFADIEQAALRAVRSGVIQTLEVSAPDVGGEMRSDHILIIPERNVAGEIVGAIAFGRNITARKRMEMELQNKNRELERFTYSVSHDLKSPLITIRSFAGVIGADLAAGRRDRIEQDLQRISGAADKMMTQLDDLLQLSRIGRVINPPEPVPLSRLANEVVDSLSALLLNNGVQISVQPDLPTVSCDRQRMLEVLQNLIENAVKYRGEQAELHIRIGQREEGGRQVFMVQDNGSGIAPKYHQHVFGLFNRLDTQVPGNGIGLSLVKRIIEEHGGEIWVESEGNGTGSAFCFSLDRPAIMGGGGFDD